MLPIREIWKNPKTDKNAGVAWWDSMAKDFSGHEQVDSNNSLTMRILEREGIITKNCSILDVGCGTGRYSIALEKLGAKVCGIDFSPRMIEFAQAAAGTNRNLSFFVDDWHTLDLKDKGWDKTFDLVLANMTPAITSAETFEKLSAASKKWCVFAKPSRRSNSILDQLVELVNAPKDTKALDDTVTYAFSMLWQEGYCPKIEYEPEVWHSKKPLEEAIFQYTKRIESGHVINEGQRRAIREFLIGCAQEGVVEETTTTTIVAMYWRV